MCIDIKQANISNPAWEDAGNHKYRDRLSYICSLLPYFEQGALFEQVSENARHPGLAQGSDPNSPNPYGDGCFIVPWHIGNYNAKGGGQALTPFAAKIGTLVCPSTANVPSGVDIPGGLSYAGCRGDLWIDWNWNEGRGMFGHGIHTLHTMSSMSDGTSNCVIISEAVIAPSSSSQKIKGGTAANLPKQNNVGPPGECLARRGGNGALVGEICDQGGTQQHGRRWGDACALFSQFFTILPPNSPSCASTNNNESWIMRAASSEHTGGVNTLIGDGAVVFISDTIATANLDKTPADFGADQNNPQWYTGPSIYGVWGSLGTISGGESVAIP